MVVRPGTRGRRLVTGKGPRGAARRCRLVWREAPRCRATRILRDRWLRDVTLTTFPRTISGDSALKLMLELIHGYVPGVTIGCGLRCSDGRRAHFSPPCSPPCEERRSPCSVVIFGRAAGGQGLLGRYATVRRDLSLASLRPCWGRSHVARLRDVDALLVVRLPRRDVVVHQTCLVYAGVAQRTREPTNIDGTQRRWRDSRRVDPTRHGPIWPRFNQAGKSRFGVGSGTIARWLDSGGVGPASVARSPRTSRLGGGQLVLHFRPPGSGHPVRMQARTAAVRR